MGLIPLNNPILSPLFCVDEIKKSAAKGIAQSGWSIAQFLGVVEKI
jgi:hypothetical protein